MLSRLLYRNFPRGFSYWDKPSGLEDSLRITEDLLIGFVTAADAVGATATLLPGAWHLRTDTGAATVGSLDASGAPANVTYSGGQLKGRIMANAAGTVLYVCSGTTWLIYKQGASIFRAERSDASPLALANSGRSFIPMTVTSLVGESFGTFDGLNFTFNFAGQPRLFDIFVRVQASITVSGATQVGLAYAAQINGSDGWPSIGRYCADLMSGAGTKTDQVDMTNRVYVTSGDVVSLWGIASAASNYTSGVVAGAVLQIIEG